MGPEECLSSPALGGGDGCGVLQPLMTVTLMFSSAAVQGWSCDAHATWVEVLGLQTAEVLLLVTSMNQTPRSPYLPTFRSQSDVLRALPLNC